MGVHDLGYRPWEQRLTPFGTRWMVIALTGVQRAWQSLWLRRLLLLAWVPAIWFGTGFFILEQVRLYPDWAKALEPFIGTMPGTEQLVTIIAGRDPGNPDSAQHAIWAWMLQSFFRYTQSTIMVLLIGVITPTLISQDVRSRAFLLYFAHPISRGSYILGKVATVWFYLAMISIVPAMLLYLLGVSLAPSFDVVRVTWDLPLRMIGASAVLMIPTSLFALAISSMTQESRYAGFGWFAICAMGWFAYGVMTAIEIEEGHDSLAVEVTRWSYVSLYHTLGRVQSWIFGFEDFQQIQISFLILLSIAIISTLVLLRRVTAPMRE
jgi:ABC-2 type transport system permease protein